MKTIQDRLLERATTYAAIGRTGAAQLMREAAREITRLNDRFNDGFEISLFLRLLEEAPSDEKMELLAEFDKRVLVKPEADVSWEVPVKTMVAGGIAPHAGFLIPVTFPMTVGWHDGRA